MRTISLIVPNAACPDDVGSAAFAHAFSAAECAAWSIVAWLMVSACIFEQSTADDCAADVRDEAKRTMAADAKSRSERIVSL